MTPADNTLDVQKYIGPCLISQNPRGRKPIRGIENYVEIKEHTSVKYGSGGAQSATPPSPAPQGGVTCECCGGYNMAWTGMPLISLTNNVKRSRSQFGPVTVVCSNPHTPHESTSTDDDDLDLNLSNLALRTHGMPLILSAAQLDRRGMEPINGNQPESEVGTNKEDLLEDEEDEGCFDTESINIRMSNCYRPVLSSNSSLESSDSSRSVTDKPPITGLGNDCVNVASDESSGISEISLPRIIKPRKRRKKDRKTTTFTSKTCEKLPGSSTPSSLVTLKPYVPLCYKFMDSKFDFETTQDEELEKKTDHVTSCGSVPSCRCTRCTSCCSWPSCHLPPSSTPVPIITVCQYFEDGYQDDETSSEISLSSPEDYETDLKLFNRTLNKAYLERRCFNTAAVDRPPKRPWMAAACHDRTTPACVFSVMCYNVLCDKYATNQMFTYCPSWALDWEYRKKGIMHEIRTYCSDFICLQEVETDQFFNFFLPELKQDGYDGIFSPKSRAKTMDECERKFVDGCAIFFRTSKFTLIHEHLVEFNQLAMANAGGSDDMLNRVMTKDNIGLTALFQTKEDAWQGGRPADPHQPLLVCTAHIHWDPEYCDVKLIQTMMLMNELRTVAEGAMRKLRPGYNNQRFPDCSQLPLLLCGDLNSLPESGVIDFLSNGHVTATHTDFKELGYRSCLQKLSSCLTPNIFTHGFKLARAYSDNMMPFTNYTFDFKGIIDYVFYSKQHLQPTGLLGPLDIDWMVQNKVIGCPHPRIPSDHFPLLVEFQMSASIPPVSSNSIVRRR